MNDLLGAKQESVGVFSEMEGNHDATTFTLDTYWTIPDGGNVWAITSGNP
jgi:hypothetical protein